MITYKRATFADKEKLFDFYKKAYPEEYNVKSGAQWSWQYEINPYNNQKLGIWLACDEQNDTIVGHTGVIFEKMLIGQKTCQVAWGIDLIVLPEYRGLGIAIGLQKKMMQDVDFYMNISMSQTTRVVSDKLGAFKTQEVTQFIQPLNVPPERIHHYLLLRTFAGKTWFNKITRGFLKRSWFKTMIHKLGINKLLSKKLSNKYQKPHKSIEPDYEIIELKKADELQQIDKIWQETKGSFDKIVIRDSTYFKWKYMDQPHKKHLIFVAKQKDIPYAYMVLREGGENEPNVGIIVDYLYAKGHIKAFHDLLRYATDFFVEHKKEFAYINATENNCLRDIRRNGFKKTRVHHPSFLTSNDKLSNYLKSDPDRWFLTFTDHELDRYPMRGK